MEIGWLKYRRRIKWLTWDKWHARKGVLGPPRTPLERMKIERAWDEKFKQGKTKESDDRH